MIDDFLTSPRDLPSLRLCRTKPRPDASAHATQSSEPAKAFATRLLLAAAMVGLPSNAPAASPESGLSKPSDEPTQPR